MIVGGQSISELYPGIDGSDLWEKCLEDPLLPRAQKKSISNSRQVEAHVLLLCVRSLVFVQAFM